MLLGCKGKEAAYVGSWKGTNGAVVNILSDKTFNGDVGPVKVSGHWTLDGADIIMQPDLINGKSPATIKKESQSKMGSLTAEAKQFIEDLDKPDIMKLSADGKSLEPDKAKDKNANASDTLTKQD